MYSAFNRIWAGMVTNGIEELSSDIKDIVSTYGTPPEDDNATILNMFVGVLTSLAGISGGLNDAAPGTSFGKYANPLTFMAGVFAQISANSGNWANIDPSELNDKLENAYGVMFKGVVGGLNDTSYRIFSGDVPDIWKGFPLAENWVWAQFADGAWLNKDLVGSLVDAYVSNTQAKFVSLGPQS